MFDLTKQPILLALAAITSAVVGACFNGNAANGLPCTNDQQCGVGVQCIEGFCGGGSGGGGANLNQCDEVDGDLAYQLGASSSAPSDALRVAALDIMGTPTPDAIVAGRGGDHVKIAFDLEGTPKEYFFNAPPPSFGDRTVLGFEVGEVNGDMKQDVVIITAGTEVIVYVYQNMSPEPPELFGDEIIVPEMAGTATLRSFQLGRLNNDSSTDIVAVLDLEAGPASINGLLLVSFGDSAAAAGGTSYFNPEALPELPLGYDLFTDSTLADIDGDGFDDLLVVGARDPGGPGLWIVRRNPAGDVTSWEEPIVIPIGSAGLIAAGHFADAPTVGQPLPGMPDFAILNPMSGSIETLLNNNGMLQEGPTSMLTGSGFASLTLSDMNCDGQSDFVYSLTDPAELRVLFGDGEGGLLSETPLVYADEGSPRGGLDVALFDDDSTPDIFSAGDPGEVQDDTRVRVLVSGAQ